ncbi:MAG: hypothetical protein JW810_08740 [Sedimentisphaerales bacterium]|nr:hypothetical protein [Sedimentisphaerales bacterium]
MKTRIAIALLASLGILIPLATWAGQTRENSNAYAYNALKCLGNQFAPDACGKVKHNIRGAALEVALHAHKMAPQQTYALKCADVLLGTGVSDKDGFLEIYAVLSDADGLKSIAQDPRRKFDLWQTSHRLARSEDFFDFEYLP